MNFDRALRELLLSPIHRNSSLQDLLCRLQYLAEPLQCGYFEPLKAALQYVNELCIQNKGEVYAQARVDIPLSLSIREITRALPLSTEKIPSQTKLHDLFSTAHVLISNSKAVFPRIGEQVLALSGGDVKIPSGARVRLRTIPTADSLVLFLTNIGKIEVMVKRIEITGAAQCDTGILLPCASLIWRVFNRFPSITVQSASLVGMSIDKSWAAVSLC